MKPTDKNTYLHFGLFHSRHLRTNIPYGQFLRIKRNSTTIEDFSSHKRRLQKQFIARGYPEGIVNVAARRAESKPRTELFVEQRKVTQRMLSWALDYTNEI